jgi:cell division protein FtsQ
MENGKIVALEDRIPKLKEQRRRKANRRLVVLLLLFFIMILIVAYAQSPLSRVQTITVTGSELYSNADIIHKTGLTNQTNIWKVNQTAIAAKLQQLPEVKSAAVKIHWPNTVLIQIKENKTVAYLKQDNYYFPVMENGKILKNNKTNKIPMNSPVLFDFKENDALNEMVKGLKNLPSEIVNSISEIHYSPKKTDPYHISLFMNDGFEVSATLSNFSEKMVHYPSIISQLDPNKKGIIDLEVGSYFKAFDPGAGGEK